MGENNIMDFTGLESLGLEALPDVEPVQPGVYGVRLERLSVRTNKAGGLYLHAILSIENEDAAPDFTHYVAAMLKPGQAPVKVCAKEGQRIKDFLSAFGLPLDLAWEGEDQKIALAAQGATAQAMLTVKAGLNGPENAIQQLLPRA